MSERRRLIVFTRYPEPGRTKTRLIPALGAEGAAELHRRMTLRTLRRADAVRADVGVRFCGGREREMERLFGPRAYQVQGGGDLGERMSRAFDEAFAAGVERAVVVGSDCPSLSASAMESAFDALRRRDAVLGPAEDGGYYLIGLRARRPALFRGIAWGGDDVLDRTLAVARSEGLTVQLLPALPDIDTPEDLPICYALGLLGGISGGPSSERPPRGL